MLSPQDTSHLMTRERAISFFADITKFNSRVTIEKCQRYNIDQSLEQDGTPGRSQTLHTLKTVDGLPMVVLQEQSPSMPIKNETLAVSEANRQIAALKP